jgi:hypothetical protein
MTPGRLPNWESGPQNHPIARVAVFVSAGALRSMGGILTSVFDGVVVEVIFALSFVGMRRIAPIAIPVIINAKTMTFRIPGTDPNAWANMSSLEHLSSSIVLRLDFVHGHQRL